MYTLIPFKRQSKRARLSYNALNSQGGQLIDESDARGSVFPQDLINNKSHDLNCGSRSSARYAPYLSEKEHKREKPEVSNLFLFPTCRELVCLADQQVTS
ncbi:hypothetical protein PUN28_006228 [Cardiocondyla obscurior]|uniref:Uncharacterized protein n=1 Tax=Cardiocondyla obscurior TaxID=286306 RepID=A0AAW2G9L4_9HYME